VGVGALLLFAWIFAGATGWKQGTLVPLALDGVTILALGWVLLAGSRLLRRRLQERALADEVERTVGLEPGVVLGSLELSRLVPPGVSPALVQAGERRVLRAIPEAPRDIAGETDPLATTWLRRGTGALTAVLLAVLALLALEPGRSASAWSGLLSPVRLAAAPVLPDLQVAPGDAEVIRGENLALDILASGRDSVTVEWRSEGEVPASRSLPVSGDSRAAMEFEDVRAPLEYRVRSSDGAVAGPFRVSVLDPLVLTDLLLNVRFPDYTGLGEEEVRGDPPPLRLPRGSVLDVRTRWSRPVAVADFVAGDTGEAVFSLQGGSEALAGQWQPVRSGVFGWRVEDREGRGPDDTPPAIEIELVEDAAPEVRFVLPATDTVLPVSRRQPLVLDAADDYGIRSLELEAVRITSLGRERESVRESVDGGDARRALLRPVLDVSSWELLPGDTVRVRAWVTDNRPGGVASEVRELSLWLPDETGLRREAGDQIDQAADLVEQMAERAARLEEETRALERAAEAGSDRNRQGRAGDESLGFDEQEDLRQALQEQEDLLASVDSLQGELQRLSEDLQESGLPDPDLQAELEELRDLMGDVGGEELQATMDSLSQRLSELSPEEAARSLEEMVQQQEEMRERLEQALEQFRRAAANQELDATATEAEDLARDEKLLAEALRDSQHPSSLEDEREDMEARSRELAERMEALEERMSRLGEERAGEAAGDAAEKTAQATESLQRSGEQMASGEMSQAAQDAEQASQELDEAAERLQEAQEEMARQQAEALQQALQQTTTDALSLARRQGELREEMRRSAPSELPDLRGSEADLLQGLRNMAQQVAESLGGAEGLGEAMGAAVGAAMRRVESTIEALERSGRGTGPSPYAAAEAAMDALNQIALQALAGSQSLANSPGDPSQQLAEQLQQLAEQQGDLMNQTESVMPLEMSPQMMQAQAEQIARGQEEVAGELGGMADDPQKAQDSLGDLQAMAQEAQELAEALAQGRLTPETLERQERLFHRLLDAGRTLKKDEFAQERESEAPGEVLREEAGPLDLSALGGATVRFPTREELQGLTPAERQLILQYFERLNRAGGGGGGS
jgi:hypothetical protein